MAYPTHLLPTTVVGSYPQPDWLVNRAALEKHGVPRTHAQDIWRVPAEWLELAQDDGTILAIRDMERAGIDIITDGEVRRESYSNRFALALEGIDAETPGEVRSQAGRVTPVPRRRILPTTRGTGVTRPACELHFARRFRIDALQREGEAVGIAFAAHFAVGDDVDAGALHVADRQDGAVVLRQSSHSARACANVLRGRAAPRASRGGAVDQPAGCG